MFVLVYVILFLAGLGKTVDDFTHSSFSFFQKFIFRFIIFQRFRRFYSKFAQRIKVRRNKN